MESQIDIDDLGPGLETIRKALKQGVVSQITLERQGFKLQEQTLRPDDASKPGSINCDAALGKRESFSGSSNDIGLLLSEIKQSGKIVGAMGVELAEKENEELHYKREFRIKLEVWKKYMVKQRPNSVSFKVHNVTALAER